MKYMIKRGWFFLGLSICLTLIQWIAVLFPLSGYGGYFYYRFFVILFFENLFFAKLLNLIILSGFTFSCIIGVQSDNLKLTYASVISFLPWAIIIYGLILIWR